MRYLYGDSTPFPLDQNFIETISAVVDACVALFLIDAGAIERSAAANQARAIADRELTRLQLLDQWVGRAVTTMMPPTGARTRTELAATTIAKSAAAAVNEARVGITKQRDDAIRQALKQGDPERNRRAVERLFVNHEIPGTRWSVRWQATGRTPRAEIGASACHGVRARLQATIADGSMWSAPVRVARFDRTISLPVERKAGSTHSDRARESAGKLNIILVEMARSRDSIVVEHKSGRPGTRQHILFRGGEHTTPVLTPINAAGEATGSSLIAQPDDAVMLARLWATVESQLSGLITARSTVSEVFLGNMEICQLERPADFAEALLASIAPFVREMRIRSRVPGEFVLKRNLESGRREEMFLPRRALEQKYRGLANHYQSSFASIGISADTTGEFAVRELHQLIADITDIKSAGYRPIVRSDSEAA